MLTKDLVNDWVRHMGAASLKEFAKAIGYSRTALYNWFDNNPPPPKKALAAMAKYCGVSIDELLDGPNHALICEWRQAAIADTSRLFAFNGREFAVTSDRNVVVGRFFISFVNSLVPYLSELNSGRFPVVSLKTSNPFGDTLTLRELVRVCWQLNTTPDHLPLPETASHAVKKVLDGLNWRPVGKTNAITCLSTHVSRFAECESMFYVRKRAKIMRLSLARLSKITKADVCDLTSALQYTQNKLEHCVNHKQLAAAINHHVLFHLLPATDPHGPRERSLSACLRLALRAPTQAAIDDTGFAAISWEQHHSFLSLLEANDLDLDRLAGWYAREHAIGTAATVMYNKAVHKTVQL